MTLLGVALLEALACLAAFIAGLKTRGRRAALAVLCGSLMSGGAVALVLLSARADFVGNGRVLHGVLLGAALLGILPPLLYYVVAHSLRRYGRALLHPMTLSGLWLLSLIPLAAVSFYVLITAVTLVGCQPGQYDCPF